MNITLILNNDNIILWREQMKKIMRSILAFACIPLFVTIAMLTSNAILTNLENWNVLVASFLGYLVQVSIFMVGLLLCAKIEGKSLEEYGITWNQYEPRNMILGLILGGLTFLVVCVPLYLSKTYVLYETHQSLEKILTQLFMFIAVGFIEEYVCRGFIQHKLLRFGPYLALLITSVVFGMLHLGNPGITLLSIVNIILAACFMGSVMYAFNSIHAAVGVHITWNWVQGAIFGIPVSGTTPSGYYSTVIKSNNSLLTGGEFGAEGSIFCTIILIILTFVFLYVANRNGNLSMYSR